MQMPAHALDLWKLRVQACRFDFMEVQPVQELSFSVIHTILTDDVLVNVESQLQCDCCEGVFELEAALSCKVPHCLVPFYCYD